jgi:hypothetical protein
VTGFTEVFRPGPTADPGRVFYTITADDIGKGLIQTTAGVIFVDSFMGKVQDHDVGRRLYRVPTNDPDIWIWSPENDTQRQARLDAARFRLG